jgi:hypothetical protein
MTTHQQDSAGNTSIAMEAGANGLTVEEQVRRRVAGIARAINERVASLRGHLEIAI